MNWLVPPFEVMVMVCWWVPGWRLLVSTVMVMESVSPVDVPVVGVSSSQLQVSVSV